MKITSKDRKYLSESYKTHNLWWTKMVQCFINGKSLEESKQIVGEPNYDQTEINNK